jgi:hypothetical protein
VIVAVAAVVIGLWAPGRNGKQLRLIASRGRHTASTGRHTASTGRHAARD